MCLFNLSSLQSAAFIIISQQFQFRSGSNSINGPSARTLQRRSFVLERCTQTHQCYKAWEWEVSSSRQDVNFKHGHRAAALSPGPRWRAASWPSDSAEEKCLCRRHVEFDMLTLASGTPACTPSSVNALSGKQHDINGPVWDKNNLYF